MLSITVKLILVVSGNNAPLHATSSRIIKHNMKLPSGAYDTLIARSVEEALDTTDLISAINEVDAAEAAERYSLLISSIVSRVIAAIPEKERVSDGAQLLNGLIDYVSARVPKLQSKHDTVAANPTPQVLSSLSAVTPTGNVLTALHPKTALAQTALLTNATGEPTLVRQLESELASADGVDILGAFIRYSGIRDLLPHIRTLTERGGIVRVMTTTYTGTAEQRALNELCAAGADVRISYGRTGTRLHAKAWLFRRNSGFTTVYVGSSNLTHQAQVTGLEWNVRASVIGNPSVVEKFDATFASYWEDDNFVPYNPEEFAKQHQAAIQSKSSSDFDLSLTYWVISP